MPIGVWPRSLTYEKRKYDTPQSESLAIVWAVLLLRLYLEKIKFTIKTDLDLLK